MFASALEASDLVVVILGRAQEAKKVGWAGEVDSVQDKVSVPS